MDPFVFAAVLFAAACHAGWNALVKGGADPLATTTLISIGSGLVALGITPMTGIPDVASWPWIVASWAIHLFYFHALIESYRTGDLGQVYPIARGSAPLMTAVVATFYLGERLSLLAWAGIVALVAGVFLLGFRGGRDLARIDRRAVGYALFTAVTIAAYTIIDGSGGRVSGNAVAYTAWMFVGTAFLMIAYAWWRGGSKVFATMQASWLRGVAGGGMQLFSYSVAIWAMTLAPLAIVGALRETSVLFAALLGIILLKEPMRPLRIGAAAAIVFGLALIRLA